jgi:hypothetical protein
LPFFIRNFSRFYVRTMKLWIQHVLDHYSAIIRYCYVKPFLGSGSRLPVMQLLVTILHTIPHKYDRHGAYILLSSM